MAGNARFHDKLHRKNHHTLSSYGFPDSGTDPIASHSEPFQGDFVINGSISSNSTITFASAHLDGDIYCENIHVNDTTYTNFISGHGTETIISDGALTGYGDHTLNLEFVSSVHITSPKLIITGTTYGNNASYNALSAQSLYVSVSTLTTTVSTALTLNSPTYWFINPNGSSILFNLPNANQYNKGLFYYVQNTYNSVGTSVLSVNNNSGDFICTIEPLNTIQFIWDGFTWQKIVY